jgi:hypothetical protein
MDLMRLAAGRYGLYIRTSLGGMRSADIEQLLIINFVMHPESREFLRVSLSIIKRHFSGFLLLKPHLFPLCGQHNVNIDIRAKAIY